MIVPVRCFSCGKQVGDKYEDYLKALKQGKTPKDAMDDLKIKRYCCRRTIFSHIDLLDEIMKYNA